MDNLQEAEVFMRNLEKNLRTSAELRVMMGQYKASANHDRIADLYKTAADSIALQIVKPSTFTSWEDGFFEVCPTCGGNADKYMNFCQDCGQKLKEVVKHEPV